MTIDARGLVERLRNDACSREGWPDTLEFEAADLIEALNATIERAGQRILILLGGYRDEMHPEAVEAFQNLAKDLAAKGGVSDGG